MLSNYQLIEHALESYKSRLLIVEKDAKTLKVSLFEKQRELKDKKLIIESKDSEINDLNMELSDLYDKWNSRLQPVMKKDIFDNMTKNFKRFYRSATNVKEKIYRDKSKNNSQKTNPIVIHASSSSKLLIFIINLINLIIIYLGGELNSEANESEKGIFYFINIRT